MWIVLTAQPGREVGRCLLHDEHPGFAVGKDSAEACHVEGEVATEKICLHVDVLIVSEVTEGAGRDLLSDRWLGPRVVPQVGHPTAVGKIENLEEETHVVTTLRRSGWLLHR